MKAAKNAEVLVCALHPVTLKVLASIIVPPNCVDEGRQVMSVVSPEVHEAQP